MGVSWIEYKGKKILFSDYRGCHSTDAMLKVLYDEIEILHQQNEKVLVMANYNDCSPTGEYFDAVKKFGKETLKAKTSKTATIGINGVKRLLFNTYISFTGDYHVRLFNDEETALEWLISRYL